MIRIVEHSDAKPTAAIGDVHGKFEMFEALLDEIEARGAMLGGIRIVTLGDYIDRGYGSRKVIERLMRGPAISCNSFVHLRGNHDCMMVDAWDDPEGLAMSRWIMCGGVQTLQSYGLDDEDELLRGRWKALVPEDHIGFLRSLDDAMRDEDRIYVHAGIRPGVPLEEQSERDLHWIRGEFLDSDCDHGRMVVHGHSPVQYPSMKANRMNLDTGAFMSGALTAAVFADGIELVQSLQRRSTDVPEVASMLMEPVRQHESLSV